MSDPAWLSGFMDDLTREEGERLTVYDDATGQPIVKGSVVKGNPTIAIGVLLSAPGGITKPESRMLTENRVASKIAEMDHRMAWWRNQSDVRQQVLLQMAYQMGVGGVLAFKKMNAALLSGDYAEAANQMLDSAWARQTPARARRMADRMKSGRLA